MIVASVFTKNKCHDHGVYPEYDTIFFGSVNTAG